MPKNDKKDRHYFEATNCVHIDIPYHYVGADLRIAQDLVQDPPGKGME